MNSPLPGRVVIICGPPCAGKSVLATRLAKEGDLIVDFDVIAQELGSPDQWNHRNPYRYQAEDRVRTLMRQLPGIGAGVAYVIRSAPQPERRAIMAKLMKASAVYVLDPGLGECLKRAQEAVRPPGTEEAIKSWYWKYRPWSGDSKHADS